MKLHHTLPLLALACFGASASAATTDWGTIGPVPQVAFVSYTGSGSVTDFYTFNLADVSDVDAYGKEFEARSVSLTDATFTLFSGTVGSGTQVGSGFTFNDTATETVYSALAAGDYYFTITGFIPKAGAAYDFEVFANSSTPPSVVPEPADAALLVAGLGMLAFIGGRRRQR